MCSTTMSQPVSVNPPGTRASSGYTFDDRFIIEIYEEVDEDTIFPVTAYDVPE